jgi:hypothetical protein
MPLKGASETSLGYIEVKSGSNEETRRERTYALRRGIGL